jgi:hypothetical protein
MEIVRIQGRRNIQRLFVGKHGRRILFVFNFLCTTVYNAYFAI